jgi:hypothetical protein
MWTAEVTFRTMVRRRFSICLGRKSILATLVFSSGVRFNEEGLVNGKISLFSYNPAISIVSSPSSYELDIVQQSRDDDNQIIR